MRKTIRRKDAYFEPERFQRVNNLWASGPRHLNVRTSLSMIHICNSAQLLPLQPRTILSVKR